MTDAARDREPTLAVLLEDAAASVSDLQAAIACGAGIVVTAGVLLFAPRWWRVALASGMLAAFGASVVASRSQLPPAVARLVRGGALVIGVGAAFALGLSLLTNVLGIWIS